MFGFQDHPNVTVAAVSDLFPDRCAALAKECRCEKTYPSLEELVKDDTIEAGRIFSRRMRRIMPSTPCWHYGTGEHRRLGRAGRVRFARQCASTLQRGQIIRAEIHDVRNLVVP